MNAKTAIPTLVLSMALASAPSLEAERVLWGSSRGDAAIPSDPTEASLSIELADDFEAWGDVSMLFFDGLACPACAAPAPKSVTLRFWRWSETDGPRALLAELEFSARDEHLKIDPDRPDWIGIRLPTPFAARGRYFVSLQIEFAGVGAWSWWRAAGEPRLAPAWERSGDGSWGPPSAPLGGPTDLAFEVWTSPWDDFERALGCGQLEIETPDPGLPGLPWRLTDVAALDAERAWAIGVAKDPGGPIPLFFERRAGRWHRIALPVSVGVDLRAIAAISEKEIWLVGSQPFHVGPDAPTRQPLALRYRAGESSWEILATPVVPEGDATFHDLLGQAEGEVWLVGSTTHPTESGVRRRARAWKWKDGSFDDLPIQQAPVEQNEELTAIAGDGIDTWMVGGGVSPAIPTAPLVLRWTGSLAKRVEVPGLSAAARLLSVAVDSSQVWLGGRSLAEDPVLLYFDGQAWSSSSNPVGGEALVWQPGLGAVTAGPAVASHRSGEWQLEPDGGLRAVALASPRACTLFAAGRFPTSLGESGAVYRLAPRGFADGFESAGFEAWSALSGAP